MNRRPRERRAHYRDLVRCVLVAVCLAGCMAGGGPVIGYGERGVVYGAEADGGFTFANLAVGAQHSNRTVVYGVLSSDAAVDGRPLDMLDATHPYARVGGGIGFSSTTGRDGHDTIEPHGIALTGLGVSLPLPAHPKGCVSTASTFAVVTLELRYVAQWELVLVPRLQDAAYPCSY